MDKNRRETLVADRAILEEGLAIAIFAFNQDSELFGGGFW